MFVGHVGGVGRTLFNCNVGIPCKFMILVGFASVFGFCFLHNLFFLTYKDVSVVVYIYIEIRYKNIIVGLINK